MCLTRFCFAGILTLMVLSSACSDEPGSTSADVGLDLADADRDADDQGRSDGLLDVSFDRPTDSQSDATSNRTLSVSGTLHLDDSISLTDDGAYVLVLLPQDVGATDSALQREALAAAVVHTGAGYVGGHISIRPSDGALRNVSYSQAREQLVIESSLFSGSVGDYHLKIWFFPDFDQNGLSEDPTHHVAGLLDVHIPYLPAQIELGTQTLSEVAPARSITLTGNLSLSQTVYVSSYGAAYAIYLLPESYDTASLGSAVPEETLAIIWVPVATGYSGGSIALNEIFRTVNPDNPRLRGDPWGDAETGAYHLGFHFFQFSYSGAAVSYRHTLNDLEVEDLPATLDVGEVTLVSVTP